MGSLKLQANRGQLIRGIYSQGDGSVRLNRHEARADRDTSGISGDNQWTRWREDSRAMLSLCPAINGCVNTPPVFRKRRRNARRSSAIARIRSHIPLIKRPAIKEDKDNLPTLGRLPDFKPPPLISPRHKHTLPGKGIHRMSMHRKGGHSAVDCYSPQFVCIPVVEGKPVPSSATCK